MMIKIPLLHTPVSPRYCPLIQISNSLPSASHCHLLLPLPSHSWAATLFCFKARYHSNQKCASKITSFEQCQKSLPPHSYMATFNLCGI